MSRWTLVTFGCAAVFAGCADTDRGPGGEEIDQAAQAIFKGKPDDAAHPQVVDLVVPLSAGQVGCTGVLVSSKTILTAAHCALSSNNAGAPLDLDVQSYAILIENLDEALEPTFLASVPKQQGVSIGQLKPSEVLIHPSYDATRSAAYDVMLPARTTPSIPMRTATGSRAAPIRAPRTASSVPVTSGATSITTGSATRSTTARSRRTARSRTPTGASRRPRWWTCSATVATRCRCPTRFG